MRTISAADANRHFSSLLRDVTGGETVTILSRGKPVAQIRPVGSDEDEREEAKHQLLARLNQQPVSGARDWRREELYEN
ncbi:MAG: type II toxin-antitoxin system prevent-host-death family antitoxin [Zoogloeaceae bacterium]|jgi:prevent-host-death family protein|nr:type II toxin-antitoxin system prevent-host-death family antitoxin [Zoogloeaceae bacterium]